MTAPRSGRPLWRRADFLKLWTGSAISALGSQVTQLALPLTALLTLNAGPTEMGLLAAAGSAPFLLIGLFAGVWVDRLRRRPLLLGSDCSAAACSRPCTGCTWSGS